MDPPRCRRLGPWLAGWARAVASPLADFAGSRGRRAAGRAMLEAVRPEVRRGMPMSSSRQQTCQSTADGLRRAAPRLAAMSAVLGFDGFVDEIVAVVDKRYDPDRFDPVESIAAMARKILAASGESSKLRADRQAGQARRQRPDHGQRPGLAGLGGDLHRQPRLPRPPPGLPPVRRPGPGDRHRRARPHRRAGVRRRQADAGQAPDPGRRELGEPDRPRRPGRAGGLDGRGRR